MPLRFFLLSVCVVLSACSRHAPANLLSCEGVLGDHAIYYNGSAFGVGGLSLLADSSDPHSVVAKLVLHTPNDFAAKEVAMEIVGGGSCVDKTVRIRFGGSNLGKIKVIGGSLVGVFRPEVQDDPFGVWRMSVFDTDSQKEHVLAGGWGMKKAAVELVPEQGLSLSAAQ